MVVTAPRMRLTPSLLSGPDLVEGSSPSESCAARASLGRSDLSSNGWPRSVSTTLAVLSISSLALPTASAGSSLIARLMRSKPSRLGWSGAEDTVICYQCDFAGCTNPTHMRLGTNATNKADYFARRNDLAGPLADVRGAAGRTRAIAAAIRAGLNEHEDAASIEKRIRAAESAGLPLTLW
jgi:hypothetical protein